FYFITTFMISYTTTYLKIPKSQILDVISWIGVVQLFATATGSYIASKIGERLLLLIATGGAVIWSVPMMMLVITGNISNIAAGVLVATFMI
ncbi:MFS transporter, partial [Acinetobacter baumannii]